MTRSLRKTITDLVSAQKLGILATLGQAYPYQKKSPGSGLDIRYSTLRTVSKHIGRHNMKTIFFITMSIFLFIVQVRSEEPILTRTSYGEITFGDRLEKVELDLNMKATSEEIKFDEYCHYVTFAIYPFVYFMVEYGIITRADAAGDVPNELGICVGTLFSEVRGKYPDVVIEEHPYDPEGHYLIFKSKDGKNAIIMEEVEGKITSVRGGLTRSVEAIEGCE
jgi:hypothetical protein